MLMLYHKQQKSQTCKPAHTKSESIKACFWGYKWPWPDYTKSESINTQNINDLDPCLVVGMTLLDTRRQIRDRNNDWKIINILWPANNGSTGIRTTGNTRVLATGVFTVTVLLWAYINYCLILNYMHYFTHITLSSQLSLITTLIFCYI